MHGDLQQVGATVSTEQAVRGWISGDTIGPDSVGSIRAVGKLSGVDAVANNAKAFDAAFRRIRSVHQAIGRRLATAIRRSFHQFADTSVDAPAGELDEHLALPVAELLESIDFAEVLATSPQREVASPQQVGKFFKS